MPEGDGVSFDDNLEAYETCFPAFTQECCLLTTFRTRETHPEADRVLRQFQSLQLIFLVQERVGLSITDHRQLLQDLLHVIQLKHRSFNTQSHSPRPPAQHTPDRPFILRMNY